MWRKILHNLCSPSAKKNLFVFLCFWLLGCSRNNPCSVVNTLLDEPQCHKLTLSSNLSYVGSKALCAGAANSRKVNISCPATAGSASQCTSISNGLPIFSILVSNNGNGAFVDGDGTTYANCGDLITAYNSGALQNILGVYSSDSSISSDVVSCTDTGGCSFASSYCYSAWNSSTASLSGTASIANGTNVLACTFINTASLGRLTPIAAGAWSSLPQVSVGGDLSFSSGWVDAY
jgi:hypothetical protein